METDINIKTVLKTKLKGRQPLSFKGNIRLEELQVKFLD